jgi:predicted site-specific integrase-resolvase
MQNLDSKEYLRPMEIQTVFGVNRVTLYKWAREDENFTKMIKPSKRMTLINRKEFEKYLELRNKANSNAE